MKQNQDQVSPSLISPPFYDLHLQASFFFCFVLFCRPALVCTVQVKGWCNKELKIESSQSCQFLHSLHTLKFFETEILFSFSSWCYDSLSDGSIAVPVLTKLSASLKKTEKIGAEHNVAGVTDSIPLGTCCAYHQILCCAPLMLPKMYLFPLKRTSSAWC